jgi:thymidine kinase
MTTIEVILGCMFSGKTTELIRRISRYQAINKPVLCINHSIDTRAKSNSIKTHEGPIGDILKCIPLADSVIKLTALDPKDGTPAIFTQRKDKINKDQILVGGQNEYCAVSRKNYEF